MKNHHIKTWVEMWKWFFCTRTHAHTCVQKFTASAKGTILCFCRLWGWTEVSFTFVDVKSYSIGERGCICSVSSFICNLPQWWNLFKIPHMPYKEKKYKGTKEPKFNFFMAESKKSQNLKAQITKSALIWICSGFQKMFMYFKKKSEASSLLWLYNCDYHFYLFHNVIILTLNSFQYNL